MLEYIVQMTRDAVQLGPEDIARLHDAGYDDTAILQMTLIGAWFNYINRVADALGIGRG
jgi:alkylhydroperoxidase family enzyme